MTFFLKSPPMSRVQPLLVFFLLLWSCNYTRACREPQAAPVWLHVLPAGAVPPAGPVRHLRAACCTIRPGLVLVHSSTRPPALSCCINMNEGAAQHRAPLMLYK